MRLNDDDLHLHLTPEDVESAQVAGVQFARALAGVPTGAFMDALGEQEQIVRVVIAEAGFSGEIAGRAADSFEAAAMLERQRISISLQVGVRGNA